MDSAHCTPLKNIFKHCQWTNFQPSKKEYLMCFWSFQVYKSHAVELHLVPDGDCVRCGCAWSQVENADRKLGKVASCSVLCRGAGEVWELKTPDIRSEFFLLLLCSRGVLHHFFNI